MRNYISALRKLLAEFRRGECPTAESRQPRDTPFLLIGHRGAPLVEPENTIASCRQALIDGANGLEVDLCLTKDEEIVLWHDWSPHDFKARLRWFEFEPLVRYYPALPEDPAYSRPVSELSLREFREHYDYKEKESDERAGATIPTIDDFLAWAIDQPTLQYVFLDVKIPPAQIVKLAEPFLERLKAALTRYNPHFELILETMDRRVFDTLRQHDGHFHYSLDTELPPGLILFPEEHSAVEAAIAHRGQYCVALRPRDITLFSWTTFRRQVQHEIARRIQHNRKHPDRKVERFVAATINDEREMECLIRLGVGGIQTDRPDVLQKVVARLGSSVTLYKTQTTDVRDALTELE